jgi:hypothetical protein
VVLRFELRFWKDDTLVYFGGPSAMLVRDLDPA